jgi:hypothetical protein
VATLQYYLSKFRPVVFVLVAGALLLFGIVVGKKSSFNTDRALVTTTTATATATTQAAPESTATTTTVPTTLPPVIRPKFSLAESVVLPTLDGVAKKLTEPTQQSVLELATKLGLTDPVTLDPSTPGGYKAGSLSVAANGSWTWSKTTGKFEKATDLPDAATAQAVATSIFSSAGVTTQNLPAAVTDMMVVAGVQYIVGGVLTNLIGTVTLGSKSELLAATGTLFTISGDSILTIQTREETLKTLQQSGMPRGLTGCKADNTCELTAAKASMLLFTNAIGAQWLVPGYIFTDSTRGEWTVIAVDTSILK